MGRERRVGDTPAAGRPSGVARDRLARRLHRDVADVRVRLEEAVLRSDALLASGQPDRAAQVLEEQQALIAELHETLASTVAAAAVEAEAETVFSSSIDGPAVFGVPAEPVAAAPRRNLRATASALASAAAVLALLIVAAPAPSPETLAAADAGTADVTDPGREPEGSATAGVRDGELSGDDAGTRAVGPNELEVRRLFTSPSPAPGSAADGPGVSDRLAGLQALVDSFVATVVRAAGELAPAPATAEPDATPVPRAVPDLGDRPPSSESDGSSGDASDPATHEAPADRAEADDGTTEDAPADGSAPQPEPSGDEGPLLPEGDTNASSTGVPGLE